MAIQPVSQAANDIVTTTQAVAPLIQESLGAIEAERRLPAKVVDALRTLGAFRLAVPQAYGGLELDPMTQVRVVEELSRMDGSVGWCAMISSAGSFASAFLAPAVAQRLCGPVDFSLAGQVVPVGRAELVNGGYRVTGRYRFGSGCQHASVIAGGCVVFEDGKPRQLATGRPEIRVMMFPPQRARFSTPGIRPGSLAPEATITKSKMSSSRLRRVGASPSAHSAPAPCIVFLRSFW